MRLGEPASSRLGVQPRVRSLEASRPARSRPGSLLLRPICGSERHTAPCEEDHHDRDMPPRLPLRREGGGSVTSGCAYRAQERKVAAPPARPISDPSTGRRCQQAGWARSSAPTRQPASHIGCSHISRTHGGYTDTSPQTRAGTNAGPGSGTGRVSGLL